jgi:hypothetical protein
MTLALFKSLWTMPRSCAWWKSFGDLYAVAGDGVGGQPLARDRVGERSTFDQFHRDEGLSVDLADFVDSADVRVIEREAARASASSRASRLLASGACARILIATGRSRRRSRAW